jgi:AraC-like DNA-binding protein
MAGETERAGGGLIDFSDASVQMFLNVKGPYEIRPHAHPHFELIYILRGTRCLVIGGKTYRARRGDLMIFRPGDVHREYSGSKTISYFVIRFHPEELSSARLEFPQREQLGPVIPLPSRERFLEIFGRMIDEKERAREGRDLLLGAYLVEFVVLLRRAVDEVMGRRANGSVTPSSPEHRIRAAVETIQQNLSGDLNLAELAKRSFMSVSHFSHVFKEAVGESPKNYLIKERIEKAKKLLAETAEPAQDIAHRLGYENSYFFYRQFKQRTGLTTAEFRRRAANRRKVHTSA